MNPLQTNPQPLGTLIVDAMRTKSISVEKLSGATGISDRIINGLIEERYENIPPAPYVRGYLLKIAAVLNLDGEALWADYVKYNDSVRRSGKKDQLPQNRFAIAKMQKKFIWVIFIAVLVGGYLLVRLASFYQKPNFELTNPLDGAVLKESTVVIKGNVEPGTKLTLQDEVIYPDKNGNFEKTVALDPGVNILTFKISKFFGKEFSVMRQITFEPAATEENPANTNVNFQ